MMVESVMRYAMRLLLLLLRSFVTVCFDVFVNTLVNWFDFVVVSLLLWLAPGSFPPSLCFCFVQDLEFNQSHFQETLVGSL